MVEHSPDGIGTHVDGKYVYANPGLVSLLGAKSEAEIVGRESLSFVHPDYVELVRARQAKVASGHPVGLTAEKLVRVDGSIVDVEVLAHPVFYDSTLAVQVVFRDITERLHQEEVIRAGEHRLQTLARGTNEAIWEWSLVTNTLWTNDAHAALFGEPVTAETMHERWLARVHPEDRERVRPVALRAMYGEIETWNIEYRFLDASGEWRVLLDRGRNVYDSAGTRQRMIGAMLDVTTLREAERERAAAEVKFRAIVEQSVVGVYIMSGARFTYVNETFATIVGQSRDELLAMSDASELFQREDSAHARCVRKNGEAVEMALYETSAIVGGQSVVIGTMLDVTERRRARRALQLSEQRHRELVDNIRDIIFRVDRDGRIASLNPSFETITGYRAEEWLGKPFTDLFIADNISPATDHFHRVMRGETHVIRDYRIRAKSGKIVELEISAEPRFVDGEIAGTIGLARDVTHQHVIERKLEDAKRLTSLGQLAATMAHEFNNVLMAIQPFAEIIGRQTPPGSPVADAVRHIGHAIARGRRVSQEILRFTNPKDADVADVDVPAWLPNFAGQLSATLPMSTTLRCSIDASVGCIRGDRAQLEQVLMNLVFNARAAMPGGGTIEIEALPEPATDGAAPFVRFNVRDEGVGISEENAAQIFDPLFTTKRNGTGLGLSIARRLVEQQGGALTMQSTPGIGSVFSVSMPVSESGPACAVPRRSVRPTARRVLLVEDEESVGAGLRALLELEDFETTWLRNGDEVLNADVSLAPDVAILDLNLPDAYGLDLLPELRRKWPNLPVIVSTGHLEPTSVKTDELTTSVMKPYQMAELLEAMARVTGTPEPFGSA
jgi:PAS domain S-box-containing protein